MNRNKKSPNRRKENRKDERINLNDYNDKEGNALKDHTDQSRKTIDRNLNEQMGGTDNTIASEPNHI